MAVLGLLSLCAFFFVVSFASHLYLSLVIFKTAFIRHFVYIYSFKCFLCVPFASVDFILYFFGCFLSVVIFCLKIMH